MNWRILTISFACIMVFRAHSFENDISINVKKPVYTKNINTLFTNTLNNAYKINSQMHQIISENQLYDAAKYYYIPSATISGEIQKKFARPAHPDPYSTFKLDLSAKMKLWSNATGDKLDAAYFSLLSSKLKYNEITNEIYKSLNANILKIEIAREFLLKADQYRTRMNRLVERMNIASEYGIMKKSDRLFADVSIKKFEESTLNVKSQIEQYISLINTYTPYNFYNHQYGVNQDYVNNSLEMNDMFFEINHVIQKNFGINSRRAQLRSDKLNAISYNEDFTLELVTQHGIKEHRLTSTKNAENQAVYGYSYDDDGSAYIGIKFNFTGLNYSNNKNKLSELSLYSKKVIELDEFIHQIFVDLNTFKQQYELILKRLESIDNQITLTIGVINNLLKEMIVDESNTLDIFRNVSSLSDLEMNRITVMNELIDIVTNVKSINAIIPNEYIIN